MSLRTKEPSTQVYFVRHGKTDFPENRIYCDAIEDPPLSAEGLRQAGAMAAYFEGFAVKRLLASPAARTWSTAEAIAKVTGVDREAAPWLVERRYGHWEGLDFSVIERQFPDEYRSWKQAPVTFTPPDGETMAQMQSRLTGGLQDFIAAHRGEILVVVTHVGPIRGILANAFGIPLEQSRQLRIDPASITKIDFGTSRNNLVFMNHILYKKL